MGAFGSYVDNIKEAVTSIFEGMAVTASHFVRKPYTVQYPDRTDIRVQDTLPFRYRGILEVDLEICTGCLACERACPIDCIVIAVEKDPADPRHASSRSSISISPSACTADFAVSRARPASIHHTTEFEGADFSLESMMRRFIKEPILRLQAEKGPETDPRIAPILNRGMHYLDEWAQPGGAEAGAEEA